MYPSVKKAWVAALRDGEYTQGEGCLRRQTEGGDRFCCLGVLADLYRRKTGGGEWTAGAQEPHGMLFLAGEYAESMELPYPVQVWAGLDDPNPVVLREDEESRFFDTLAEMNDAGSNFQEIADLIEHNF